MEEVARIKTTRMEEEDIKKLAEEKGKKAAKEEAIAVGFVIFSFVSFLAMLVGSATPHDYRYLFMVPFGALLALAFYAITEKRVYKKYYEKYHQDLTLSRKSDNE